MTKTYKFETTMELVSPKTITLNGVEYNLVPVNETKTEEPTKVKTKIKYRANGSLAERLPNAEPYYFVTVGGHVSCSGEYNNNSYNYRFLTGNYFDTKEAAQIWADKLKRAYELKLKLEQINIENDWVADWENQKQAKYYFLYWDYPNNNKRNLFDYHSRDAKFYMCEQARDYAMSNAVSREDFKNFIEVFSC